MVILSENIASSEIQVERVELVDNTVDIVERIKKYFDNEGYIYTTREKIMRTN